MCRGGNCGDRPPCASGDCPFDDDEMVIDPAFRRYHHRRNSHQHGRFRKWGFMGQDSVESVDGDDWPRRRAQQTAPAYNGQRRQGRRQGLQD